MQNNIFRHICSRIFYLVHRKRVIQRKRNFRTIFESIISYITYNKGAFLLLSESLTLQILWNTICDFGLVYFFAKKFLKIHIYFQKSTHIFHNVSESQNATNNICRVRDSERNNKDLHCSSFKMLKLIIDPKIDRKLRFL